jgi:hypothetical protein
MSQLMEEMGIPAEYQEQVKQYKNFWSAGNVEKFQALKIQNFSNYSIELGIMCVLASVHVLSLEELTKAVLLGGFEDNVVLKKLEHYKVEGLFWRMIENTYGYKDNAPTIKRFFATIVMTATEESSIESVVEMGSYVTYIKPDGSIYQNRMQPDKFPLHKAFLGRRVGEKVEFMGKIYVVMEVL